MYLQAAVTPEIKGKTKNYEIHILPIFASFVLQLCTLLNMCTVYLYIDRADLILST